MEARRSCPCPETVDQHPGTGPKVTIRTVTAELSGASGLMDLHTVECDLLDQDVEVILNAWNRNLIPLVAAPAPGSLRGRAGVEQAALRGGRQEEPGA